MTDPGGHVVWNSTPGCWGPMITPAIRGGHEVAQPVAVAGAEPGDAIAVRIKDMIRRAFQAPTERLDACGLLRYAVEQYGERQ